VGYNATEQSAVVDQVSKKLQEQASDNVVFGVGAAPELGPGVLRLLAYGDFAAAKNRSEDVSQRLALPEGYSVVIEDGGGADFRNRIQQAGRNVARGLQRDRCVHVSFRGQVPVVQRSWGTYRGALPVESALFQSPDWRGLSVGLPVRHCLKR
jgi:hypothetical protein